MKLFDKMIDKKIFNQMKNCSMNKFRQIFKMINNSKKIRGSNKKNNIMINDFIII